MAQTTRARCRPARINKTTLAQHRRGIANRLATVRGERSQRSFAKDLGVFQQNVNRYENGTMPHPDFLITLALSEGVSIDWLLLGKGRPPKR